MNPKAELNFLECDMKNLTNELTELYVGEASNGNHANIFSNCGQLVAVPNPVVHYLNQCASVPISHVKITDYDFGDFDFIENRDKSAKALQTIDQKASIQANVLKHPTSDTKMHDFQRRASAGDIWQNEGAVHFHRRASAADAQIMNLSAKSNQVDNREELRNYLKYFFENKYVEIAQHLNDQKLPFFSMLKKPQNRFNLKRRGSAADVENGSVKFAGVDVNLNCFKRRASTADVEGFSKLTGLADQPAALLNVAANSETPSYWHVGPEVDTVANFYKKILRPQSSTEACSTVGNDINEKQQGPGLFDDSEESNDVVRLFNLFRTVNIVLVDVEPFPANDGIAVNKLDTINEQKFLMPFTLNIRTQIKHLIHKAYGFCHDKSRKLDEYHCADRQQYFDCSRCLFVLRKITKQLETFRNVDFEHRNAVFVDSFAAAKAKNVEIVLKQMIDKIRECNINVEVYRWSIQLNIQQTGLPSLDTLEKAFAIAAAMKIDVSKENPNFKSKKDLEDAANGNKASLKINNDNEILHEPEIENSRNTMRFVGNFY